MYVYVYIYIYILHILVSKHIYTEYDTHEAGSSLIGGLVDGFPSEYRKPSESKVRIRVAARSLL